MPNKDCVRFQSGKGGLLFICDPQNEEASRKEIEEILRCIVGGYAEMLLETKTITKEQFEAFEKVAADKSGPISKFYGHSPCASQVEGYLPYVCNHAFLDFFYADSLDMVAYYYDHLRPGARKAQYVRKVIPFLTCCRSNTKAFLGRDHFVQVFCAIDSEFPFNAKKSKENFFAVDVHVRKNDEMEPRVKELQKLFADELRVENYSMPKLTYEEALLDPVLRKKYDACTTVYVHIYILGAYTFMGYTDTAEQYETLYIW